MPGLETSLGLCTSGSHSPTAPNLSDRGRKPLLTLPGDCHWCFFSSPEAEELVCEGALQNGVKTLLQRGRMWERRRS